MKCCVIVLNVIERKDELYIWSTAIPIIGYLICFVERIVNEERDHNEIDFSADEPIEKKYLLFETQWMWLIPI